jgi:hypothetical protein
VRVGLRPVNVTPLTARFGPIGEPRRRHSPRVRVGDEAPDRRPRPTVTVRGITPQRGRDWHSLTTNPRNQTDTKFGNRSVVLSRLRQACRDQVGVPLFDVVGPRLLDLLFEIDLVSWDRRRCLVWPARPKVNDPSPASMQVGEATRSGFVLVDELVERVGHGGRVARPNPRREDPREPPSSGVRGSPRHVAEVIAFLIAARSSGSDRDPAGRFLVALFERWSVDVRWQVYAKLHVLLPSRP